MKTTSSPISIAWWKKINEDYTLSDIHCLVKKKRINEDYTLSDIHSLVEKKNKWRLYALRYPLLGEKKRINKDYYKMYFCFPLGKHLSKFNNKQSGCSSVFTVEFEQVVVC